MASVASQLIEEVTAHAQNESRGCASDMRRRFFLSEKPTYFSRYLINDRIFGKKIKCTKFILIFSKDIVGNNSYSKNNSKLSEMSTCLHLKYVFLTLYSNST